LAEDGFTAEAFAALVFATGFDEVAPAEVFGAAFALRLAAGVFAVFFTIYKPEE